PQGRAERIWILGTTAGNQTVTASVSGVSISKTINALARTSCGFSSSQAFHAFPPRDTLRFQPTTRTVRVAVLFIDFPDLAGTRTVAQMMSDIVNPAAAMLSGTTYGKLQLQLVATSGWMRMPESANDLRWTDGKMTHLDYINTVIARHDGVFDFSTIDVVWIFRSSRFDPQISSGTATFFKGSNVIPPRDGREMKSFVTFGSDVHLMNVYTYWPVYGRNVVAHEMGHVYGLPDLYAYQSAPGENGLRFSGGWSFMGWVAPATSWTAAERLYVGALTDNDLLCPPSEPFTAQVTMTQIAMTTGVRAIGLRSTATRMTFIESRIAVLQDANACQLGVLVYDVNGAETLGNGPIRVREIRPSAAGAQMDECGVKWNAPARSGDVFELGDPNVEVQILSIIAPTGEARIKITRR
ncbi:MAG TPA: hypothetical protein VJR92_12365, partial [Gemmatimonadaceae bacterium]|nr:hypothetical protein [Gemmatimonadaceae bacterium]